MQRSRREFLLGALRPRKPATGLPHALRGQDFSGPAQVAAPGDVDRTADGDVRAEIGAACLAFGNVMCRSCGDACPREAIRFVFAGAGTLVPRLAADACTGCGDCQGVCPAGAISLRHFTSAPPLAEGIP